MIWLSYGENVMPSEEIDRTAILLDPYFNGEPSVITSGVRTSQKQLAIIVEKIALHKLAKLYPEYLENIGQPHNTLVKVDGKSLYWWQRSWSKLLNINDIVNPPVPAECTDDYIHPKTKENKKGQIIPISNHQKGMAFDIGGGLALSEKAERVDKAYRSGDCFIKGYLTELVNNAVHIDTVAI